jgi:hypothetical protein
MLSWMQLYPSLGVQTGRMTIVNQYAGSSRSESWFIVVVITNAHLLTFPAHVTTIIAPGLMPRSAMCIGVSSTATGAGVLLITAAAAAMLPASGMLITLAIAVSGLS